MCVYVYMQFNSSSSYATAVVHTLFFVSTLHTLYSSLHSISAKLSKVLLLHAHCIRMHQLLTKAGNYAHDHAMMNVVDVYNRCMYM
jgi:hypothetical protein